MNLLELAWLAGLLEGEGCFLTMSKPNGYLAWRITLKMTDEDVVRRASILMGTKLRGPMGGTDRWKPHFETNLGRRQQVQDLLSRLEPFMGMRRGKRIGEMLEEMNLHPPRPRWRHGTMQGYDARGCRCPDCRAANAEKGRRYRRIRQDS